MVPCYVLWFHVIYYESMLCSLLYMVPCYVAYDSMLCIMIPCYVLFRRISEPPSVSPTPLPKTGQAGDRYDPPSVLRISEWVSELCTMVPGYVHCNLIISPWIIAWIWLQQLVIIYNMVEVLTVFASYRFKICMVQCYGLYMLPRCWNTDAWICNKC